MSTPQIPAIRPCNLGFENDRAQIYREIEQCFATGVLTNNGPHLQTFESQAAEFLGKCEETIRRWARSGTVQGVKLPDGDWRFDPADVQALLCPCEVRSRPEEAKLIEAQINASFTRALRARAGRKGG